MSDEFVFINTDIERLAIHIRQTMHKEPVRAITVVAVGLADKVLIPGPGLLVGYALMASAGAGGTLALCNGPSAEAGYLNLAVAATSAVLAWTAGTDGFPFDNELVLADLAAVMTFTGQVFVRTHPRR